MSQIQASSSDDSFPDALSSTYTSTTDEIGVGRQQTSRWYEDGAPGTCTPSTFHAQLQLVLVQYLAQVILQRTWYFCNRPCILHDGSTGTESLEYSTGCGLGYSARQSS